MLNLWMLLQEVPVGPVIPWGELGAVVVTAGVGLVAVPFLRYWLPIFKTKYEWIMPIVAMVAPAALAYAASLLGGFFGYPVDFGPLIDLFQGGAVAVVVHQAYKQATKKPAKK